MFILDEHFPYNEGKVPTKDFYYWLLGCPGHWECLLIDGSDHWNVPHDLGVKSIHIWIYSLII